MARDFEQLKEIHRRQALLKIIHQLPASIQNEAAPMQSQIVQDLKSLQEGNRQAVSVIDLYYERLGQLIKSSLMEGILSRRAFLQISSLVSTAGLFEFLFPIKSEAGGLIPFGFIKQAAPTVKGEAVDFDGTNDYLIRSSDLVGNADGKTFTFSAWIWMTAGTNPYIYRNTSGYFEVRVNTNGIIILGYVTGGGGQTLNVTVPITGNGIDSNSSLYSWYHILISIDLNNTANRYVYVNDVQTTPNWTIYLNNNIFFTNSEHRIGSNGSAAALNGRLAHVYLDKTYRDLTNATNRRLFITADYKPAANQAALNPILYLKMDDSSTCHVNSGAGGNFTLTGVVARSGRGPNQYNCAYSSFNGSTQYLSKTSSLTGVNDSSVFTFNCIFKMNESASRVIFYVGNSTTLRGYIGWNASNFKIVFLNSAGTVILNATVDTLTTAVVNRNYILTISIDLSNSSKRFVYVNGIAASVTWATYTSDLIDFLPASPYYRIGTDLLLSSGAFWSGFLGDIWFDTSYIDLSVPANLAKFVSGSGGGASPVSLGINGESPTGTAPLIYLPLYGHNAGKNYGTGGDFTVNSGPFTGARGPNEFWANKASIGSTSSPYNSPKLYRTSTLNGIAVSKKFTISCTVKVASTNSPGTPASVFVMKAGATKVMDLYVNIGGANPWYLIFNNSYLIDTATGGFGSLVDMLISVDTTDATKTRWYVRTNNGTAGSWSSIFNGTGYNFYSADINFPSVDTINLPDGFMFYGDLSEFYFSTDYIDFSQESNRLKFRDAFGNPVDLKAQIAAGVVPNPAIYMRFDPTNLGKNSGTGGDFMVSGTITDGGQI